MNITNNHLLFSYENFHNRLSEVTEYLNFVRGMADMDSPVIVDNPSVTSIDLSFYRYQLKQPLLTYNQDSITKRYNLRDENPISRDLQKTLRASTYLLLYNLIESTMSEAINAIHETIKEEGHSITDLSENLHRVILSSFQKGLTESKIGELASQNKDPRDDLLNLGYDKKKLFSGNVDYDVIVKFCNRYGIKPIVYKVKNGDEPEIPLKWDKEVIKNIRRKRNSLAHGAESFVQCGQNMPVDTMNTNLMNVIAVLMAVFNGLNNFLNNSKYLRHS